MRSAFALVDAIRKWLLACAEQPTCLTTTHIKTSCALGYPRITQKSQISLKHVPFGRLVSIPERHGEVLHLPKTHADNSKCPKPWRRLPNQAPKVVQPCERRPPGVAFCIWFVKRRDMGKRLWAIGADDIYNHIYIYILICTYIYIHICICSLFGQTDGMIPTETIHSHRALHAYLFFGMDFNSPCNLRTCLAFRRRAGSTECLHN